MEKIDQEIKVADMNPYHMWFDKWAWASCYKQLMEAVYIL